MSICLFVVLYTVTFIYSAELHWERAPFQERPDYVDTWKLHSTTTVPTAANEQLHWSNLAWGPCLRALSGGIRIGQSIHFTFTTHINPAGWGFELATKLASFNHYVRTPTNFYTLGR